jgi:hypothetical protein
LKHPESLLIPLLMLSDYWLTIAGARLRRVHLQQVQTPSFELNPLWKETVAKLRWFNGRHFLLTLLIGTFVIYAFESPYTSDSLADLFFGFTLTVLGVVNGRHIANLAVFSYLRGHPGQLQGQVAMSHELSLWMSLSQTTVVLVPIALLLIPVPAPRTVAALAGVIGMMLLHLIWLWRSRSRARGSKAVAELPGGGSRT